MQPARDEVEHQRRVALVGDVLHLDFAEQRDLRGGDDARRVAGAVVELARIGAGVLDQLRQVLRRQRRMGEDEEREAPDQRDRREVRERVVRRVLAQGRHRRNRAVGAEEDRVAVGRRLDHGFPRDRAVGARPVVDDDRLAELLRQRRRKDAAYGVGQAAGGKLQDQADRLVRVRRLRQCARRERRKDQRRGKQLDGLRHGLLLLRCWTQLRGGY